MLPAHSSQTPKEGDFTCSPSAPRLPATSVIYEPCFQMCSVVISCLDKPLHLSHPLPSFRSCLLPPSLPVHGWKPPLGFFSKSHVSDKTFPRNTTLLSRSVSHPVMCGYTLGAVLSRYWGTGVESSCQFPCTMANSRIPT